jgi:SAM-dependent methyltransferase
VNPGLLLGVSALVHEAHTSGLLSALLAGPGSAAQLAARAGLTPGPVGLVLSGLVALELAAEDGEVFCASPALKTFGDQTPGGAALQREVWGSLGAALRGDPAASWEDRVARYPGVVAGLGALWGEVPHRLAEWVGGGEVVVDVGCGSGPWGRALTRPGGRLVGVDLPPVLQRLQEAAATSPIRVELIGGDMHAVEVPVGQADRVVIANVLRLEPPDRAAALLARWARALRPGGRLVVVDALAGGTPEAELDRRIYALHLGLRFPNGRVHPPAEVEAWMAAAGLREIGSVSLGAAPGALGALVGVAPC